MNMTASKVTIETCDFCHVQGVGGRDILNKYGWYFCLHCLAEVEGPAQG